MAYTPPTVANLIKGIDVSNHQGNVNWPAVARSGIKFALMKATQGANFTDPYFAQNRAGARANGVYPGAYLYFDARMDPVAQVNQFMRVVGSVPPGDLQPALDLEESFGMPASTVVSRALQVLSLMQQKTGRNPFLYTYSYYFRTGLGNPQVFANKYPLWIAAYQTDVPDLHVGGYTAWTIWQYDDHGRNPGIGGGKSDCDMNAFFGSAQVLRKFAGY